MKKIVFLTSRFPFPLNKGDKLRAYNQIKSLSEIAEIHLISISEQEPSEEALNELKIYCKDIYNFNISSKKRKLSLIFSLFSMLPFSVRYFFNKKIKIKINKLITIINPDSIHAHLIRMAEYVPREIECYKTIDFMDCFSIGAYKEMKEATNFLKKIALRVEYNRLIIYERNIFNQFNSWFIISESDKINMPIAEKNKIKIIPNGVDFKTFYPIEITKEYDLLFSGHMGYVPNIVAAKYLITQIHPKVKNKTLLIAGIGLTKEIKDLKQNNIDLKENFDHIRDAFGKSKILIAPMLISIGLQNKILQAMAMKIPVVCSVSANESICAEDGKTILLASSPQEYTNQIEYLLKDTKYYNLIADNAFNFVKENYNWDIVNLKLGKFILNE